MTWVGVAGWDYPDWNGIVYPPGSSRGFDKLAWIARFVDAVEINATFYRPAKPAVAASWLRRIENRPGFRFAAKAHRSWTHESWNDAAAVRTPTLDGLAPLRDAGVLGALLVQFPQSFHWTPESRARLGRLMDGLNGWPVVVEVRHRSWDDDHAAAWLRECGVGTCVVDQPLVGGSTLRFRPRVTSGVAYIRLHGRNSALWFDPAAGRDERYDYLYDDAELGPIADAARDMGRHANALYAIANNHFRGQALVNALQLKHLITGIAPEAPGELVEAYPALRTIVQVSRERLF